MATAMAEAGWAAAARVAVFAAAAAWAAAEANLGKVARAVGAVVLPVAWLGVGMLEETLERAARRARRASSERPA